MKIVERIRVFESYTGKEMTADKIKAATIIIFDEREYEEPELIFVEKGRVRISDHHQGLVNWDESKKQYVRHYYMSEREIGQLKEILIEKEAA